MEKLTPEQIKELNEEMERNITLYNMTIQLTPEKEVGLYVDTSEDVDKMREAYPDYETVEKMLFLDVSDSVDLYGKYMTLMEMGKSPFPKIHAMEIEPEPLQTNFEAFKEAVSICDQPTDLINLINGLETAAKEWNVQNGYVIPASNDYSKWSLSIKDFTNYLRQII